LGFDVLNVAPAFQEYADRHHVFLHGFSNTQLGAGHWNAEGHRYGGGLIAGRLCELLRRPASPADPRRRSIRVPRPALSKSPGRGRKKQLSGSCDDVRFQHPARKAKNGPAGQLCAKERRGRAGVWRLPYEQTNIKEGELDAKCAAIRV
jgi:hypothetical protein